MGIKTKNEFVINGNYAIMKVRYKDLIMDVKLDIEDVQKVKDFKWNALYDKTLQVPSYYIYHRYASKARGKGVLKLHRIVMDCPRDKVIDHINHDTLDNRKSNLRICTHFENQQNLRSKKSPQTGVFKRKRNNREFWTANISKNCKKYQKDFKTYEEAVIWRKEMEQLLYKEVMLR